MPKETIKDPAMTGNAENVAAPKKRPGSAPQEAVYTADEFAANAGKLFHTRKECVLAALGAAGRSGGTLSEAKQIVEDFLKKEVR